MSWSFGSQLTKLIPPHTHSRTVLAWTPLPPQPLQRALRPLPHISQDHQSPPTQRPPRTSIPSDQGMQVACRYPRRKGQEALNQPVGKLKTKGSQTGSQTTSLLSPPGSLTGEFDHRAVLSFLRASCNIHFLKGEVGRETGHRPVCQCLGQVLTGAGGFS